MKHTMNEQVIIGNVGRDPEVKTFDNNKKASFTIASTERYKKDGKDVEETEWFNVSVWGKLADIVEKYVKKGSQLYVAGPTKTRTYQTKEGETKTFREVVVEKLHFLGKKEGQPEPAKQEPVDRPADSPDLPF